MKYFCAFLIHQQLKAAKPLQPWIKHILSCHTKQNLNAGLLSFPKFDSFLGLIGFCLHFISSFTHKDGNGTVSAVFSQHPQFVHAAIVESLRTCPHVRKHVRVRKHVLQHAFNKNILISVYLWTHYPSSTSPPLLLIGQL